MKGPAERRRFTGVSPLHYWLGIGVMVITFGGGLLRLSGALFEAAKWPEKVDSSLIDLTAAVNDLRGVAGTMQREQAGMKGDIQRALDAAARVDRWEAMRRSSRVPVLSPRGATVQ